MLDGGMPGQLYSLLNDAKDPLRVKFTCKKCKDTVEIDLSLADAVPCYRSEFQNSQHTVKHCCYV